MNLIMKLCSTLSLAMVISLFSSSAEAQINSGQAIVAPTGKEVILNDGTKILVDGTIIYPDGTKRIPNGDVVFSDGTILKSD